MLLRYLLNFWFGPALGLFFAASAVGDVTAGGGDGASGGGSTGGDVGGGAASDSTSGDDSTVDGGGGGQDDGAIEDGATPDGARDSNSLVDDGTGRKIPQKYAELFKTDKALKETYLSQQALKRTFPGGVRDAIKLAKDVEEFGGVEGVQQLQADLQSHAQDAELFQSDPGKWAEAGFAENAESALKAWAHAFDYVAEKHPEHYNHVGAKIIINDLDSSLPVRDIHAMLAGLKDNPQAQQLAKKLADYYNSRFDLSKKVPEKQVSAQEKALTEKGNQLSAKEQEIRNKTINLEAGPHMTKAIETSLATVAKSSGFDLGKLQKDQPNRYGRFLKDVRSAVHSNVLSDTKWLDRYSDALAKGDTAKCVRMLNARHDQAIQGNGRDAGVVAPIFAEWFGPPKAGARGTDKTGDQTRRAAPGNSGTGNTAVRVNAMPPKNEIAWGHEKTSIIDQIAMRKDGKLVTWAK